MDAVEALKESQQTLLQALAGLSPADEETPGACGEWSVKNIVAHLASFAWVVNDVLATFCGEELTPRLTRRLELGDRFIDVEVNARQARTLSDALGEFTSAHTQTLALATQIPLWKYRQVGTLPWYREGVCLDDFLVYAVYGHLCEHSAQIARFRDDPSRERAAKTTAVITQLNQALNRWDLDATMDLFAEDAVFENTAPPPDGGRYEGKAAIRAFWEAAFRSTTRIDFRTEDQFVHGEHGEVRWNYQWANQSGEHGRIRGIDVFTIRGGKVLENFSYVKG